MARNSECAFAQLRQLWTPSLLGHPGEGPPVEDDKGAPVWYFGYGSNLDSSTFLGRRQIKPLAQRTLVVPGWRLNFEIPGLPYAEPGFGSIRKLAPDDDAEVRRQPDLQGVAYLVTPADCRHIIATEGGSDENRGYAQIQITGQVIGGGAADEKAGEKEDLSVWTLQARRPRRRCLPSVRYMTLIRNGAREHGLGAGYIAYLDAIQTYKLEGKRKQAGAAIFLAFWGPIFLWLFAIRPLLTDKRGRVPAWLANFTAIVFLWVWKTHDEYWAPQFGRGDYNEAAEDRCSLPDTGLHVDEKV